MSKTFEIILSVFLCALLISGCSESTEPDSVEYFKINIDSVQSLNSISLGDTLQLRLYGFVGSNGCYSFSKFESSQTNSNLDLTVWGKYTPADVCATVIIEMRGTKYPVVPVSKGTFEIVIHQPDGTTLKDTIIVQ